MPDDLDRLVRQLDAWRPGDDASALAALVPLARRRNDPALLERLARCFVDTRLTALRGHLLSAPVDRAALGVDAAELASAAATLVDYAKYRWDHCLLVLQDAELTRLATDAMTLLRELAHTPALALADDAIEALAWVLWDDRRRFHLLDRWVAHAGIARAARILAMTAAWHLEREYDDGSVIGLELALDGTPQSTIDREGMVRLFGWLRAEPQLAPNAEVLLEALLGAATLVRAACEGLVALWLAETEPAFVERLAARLRDASSPPDAALAPLVAALRPAQADILPALLSALAPEPDAVADLLPELADRLGPAALEPLIAFRERAGHHKYVSLAAQAIARIPDRETVRYLAPELGHKAKSRAEDARTACMLHPVEALAELPRLIATLAADTTRKGQRERQRQVEAMTTMLEALARVQPRATWILLPTLGDAALAERLAAQIPDAHRSDPVVEAASNTHTWLMQWPIAPAAKTSLVVTDACGALDREHVRRLVLALDPPSTRAQRLDTLGEHLEADNLARLADALLEAWDKRARRRYANRWVFELAARFGDHATHQRTRDLLASLADTGQRGPLAAAIHTLGEHAGPTVLAELLGPLRDETLDHDLRTRLEAMLEGDHRS